MNYAQGGDAQAISEIARRYYGSYRNMFDAHGWNEPGEKMMTSAPSLIVGEYGSVRRFEELHQPTEFMSPMEAIYSEPPNVWLTSFYGFRPEEWGFLGFTKEGDRRGFLQNTEPGVLVVVYGAGKAEKGELHKVIGVQQCSHQLGNAREFMAPHEWNSKQGDPERINKWNHAVNATRAWRVTPESRLEISEFAPKSTETGAWQHIGSRGVRLSRQEALNILKLDLQEVNVYGETKIEASSPGTAREILAPSKAGPVSQNPFTTMESEGPKHLYVLKLVGDLDAFLGKPTNGSLIIKAGFSKSPETRCADYNRALPRCAYRWEVLFSGDKEGMPRHPSSEHAKAGERAMQQVLCSEPLGESLGGEFFLARLSLIEQAWAVGNRKAKEFINDK